MVLGKPWPWQPSPTSRPPSAPCYRLSPPDGDQLRGIMRPMSATVAYEPPEKAVFQPSQSVSRQFDFQEIQRWFDTLDVDRKGYVSRRDLLFSVNANQALFTFFCWRCILEGESIDGLDGAALPSLGHSGRPRTAPPQAYNRRPRSQQPQALDRNMPVQLGRRGMILRRSMEILDAAYSQVRQEERDHFLYGGETAEEVALAKLNKCYRVSPVVLLEYFRMQGLLAEPEAAAWALANQRVEAVKINAKGLEEEEAAEEAYRTAQAALAEAKRQEERARELLDAKRRREEAAAEELRKQQEVNREIAEAMQHAVAHEDGRELWRSTSLVSCPEDQEALLSNQEYLMLEENSPGWYTLRQNVVVSPDMVPAQAAETTESPAGPQVVVELEVGNTVKVLEVRFFSSMKLSRARIQEPEGWFTLEDKTTGIRNALREDQVVGALAQHALRAQENLPGFFQLREDVLLTPGPVIATEALPARKLENGLLVQAVEVRSLLSDRMIRLRLVEPDGWINLLDLDTGKRFADKQEDDAVQYIKQILQLEANQPGWFTLKNDSEVARSLNLPKYGSDEIVAELDEGMLVYIVEVQCLINSRTIRGRLEHPAGWISLRQIEPRTRAVVPFVPAQTQQGRPSSAKRQSFKPQPEEEFQDQAQTEGQFVPVPPARQPTRPRPKSPHIAHFTKKQDAADVAAALRLLEQEENLPGWYLLAEELRVTSSFVLRSGEEDVVGSLEKSSPVEIVEARYLVEARQIRARLNSPAGWITLVEVEQGKRYASKSDKESALATFAYVKQEANLPGLFTLKQAVDIEAESFPIRNQQVATLPLGYLVQITEVSYYAKQKLARALIEEPRGWFTLENGLTGLRTASREDPDTASVAQAFLRAEENTPGYFILSEDVTLTPGLSLAAEGAILETGLLVKALEVRCLFSTQVLRMRLEEPAGWVTLLDMATGARFAIKQDEQHVQFVTQTMELDPHQPGWFTTSSPSDVSRRLRLPKEGEEPLATLEEGVLVEVQEVKCLLDSRILRGRLKSPAGWISLLQIQRPSLDRVPSEERLAELTVPGEDFTKKQDPTAVGEALALLEHQENQPGWFMAKKDVDVTPAFNLRGDQPAVGRVEKGAVVQVLEVRCLVDAQKLRGRLSSPAGWVSLSDIGTSEQWLKRETNRTARRAEKLTTSAAAGPGIYVVETGMDVSPLAGVVYPRRSEVVEELEEGQMVQIAEVLWIKKRNRLRARIERPVAGWITVQNTRTCKAFVTKQLDSPGVYVLSKAAIISPKLTLLSPDDDDIIDEPKEGTMLRVLEVVHLLDVNRVRGRTQRPPGWFSLENTETGGRWARKQEHQPGKYSLLRRAYVSPTLENIMPEDSEVVAVLEEDEAVEIVEIEYLVDLNRVRGRLETPAGWISLHNSSTDTSFATPYKERPPSTDSSGEDRDTESEEEDGEESQELQRVKEAESGEEDEGEEDESEEKEEDEVDDKSESESSSPRGATEKESEEESPSGKSEADSPRMKRTSDEDSGDEDEDSEDESD